MEQLRLLFLLERCWLLDIVKSSVGTKFISRYGDHLCQLAIDAVKIVNRTERKEIDIKRYIRIEKVRLYFKQLFFDLILK